MTPKVQIVAPATVCRSAEMAEMLVGERGFEPPAPASRTHFPHAHTAHFRAFSSANSAQNAAEYPTFAARGSQPNLRALSFCGEVA